MNTDTQILTFANANTASQHLIAYLMADQVFDAIDFNTVSLSDINGDYIMIGSIPVNSFVLNYNGPVTITFNPSAINLPKKINRIVYEFSDGSPTIDSSFYYSPTSVISNNYPFSAEPGDPRNFSITKTFYSSTYFTASFEVLITVYQLGITDPVGIIYNININAPQLDGDGGYFEEMHLISSRMFGLNDDILYTFETKNPNYVVPLQINWNKTPETIVQQTNVSKSSLRPYKILEPYEIENLQKNSNIKVLYEITVPSNKPNIDYGITQTFRLLNEQPYSTIYPFVSGHLITQNGKYLRINNYYNSNLNK
jgi:hypothetical protein